MDPQVGDSSSVYMTQLQNGFSPYPDFCRTFNSQRHSQHVLLPRDYRKYYPTPLPPTATLKKPDGRFWKAKWTETEDGMVSFQDGWPKFVKDNGIVDGDVILFMYDSIRMFWLTVYRNGVPLNPKDPVNIQEISDDDDDDYGDMEAEEDSNENKIISLSLGSSDEDYDANAVTTEVNRAHVVSKGVSSSHKKRSAIHNPEMYIDDQSNPCFISTSPCTRGSLVIARQVIKDYDLKFGDTINLIDGFGELKANVVNWKDRTVVNKWDMIYKRNNATEDIIICEILREEGIVRAIKFHFLKK